MTTSSAPIDLDDRLDAWRLESASVAELRMALLRASPNMAVPLSWRHPELVAACKSAGVVPRPVSRPR